MLKKLSVLLVALLALTLARVAIAETDASDVRPFVRGSWQAIRAAHAGKPVAIHFWGVTCAPCRVEMSIWGQLVKQRTDLTLVTIHAERSPPDARIMPRMLSEAGLATAENWAFAERFLQALRYEIDPEWQGETPMTLLVSGDGTTKTIIGSVEAKDVGDWLDAEKRADAEWASEARRTGSAR